MYECISFQFRIAPLKAVRRKRSQRKSAISPGAIKPPNLSTVSKFSPDNVAHQVGSGIIMLCVVL